MLIYKKRQLAKWLVVFLYFDNVYTLLNKNNIIFILNS